VQEKSSYFSIKGKIQCQHTFYNGRPFRILSYANSFNYTGTGFLPCFDEYKNGRMFVLILLKKLHSSSRAVFHDVEIKDYP